MPRPSRLSRPLVVAAALELVDDAGADGLTMRALARRLGVDPMAVYRHVRDKDDLLGAMCDVVVGDLPQLDPGAPWEPQVRALMLGLHGAVLRRPAVLPVLASAPVTPVSLALAHDAITTLVAAGADEGQAATAFSVLFAYVVGAAMVAGAQPSVPADQAGLRDGARALLGPRGAPHLDAASGLMQQPDDLERGLDLILAGVRATLPEAPAS